MKKNMIRKISFLLAGALLVSSAFSGCGRAPQGGYAGSSPGETTSGKTLPEGEFLYLALGDEKLAAAGEKAPVSVSVESMQEGGMDIVQSAAQDEVDAVVRGLMNIRVGSRTDTIVTDSDTDVHFFWEDGTQTLLHFNGDNLAWQNNYYELTGDEDFRAAVNRLLAGAEAEAETEAETEAGYVDAVCSEQGFRTKCSADASQEWVEDDGFYIGLDGSSSIPYILIYRRTGLSIGAEKFLTDVRIPDMQETYGEDMISVGEVEALSVELADGTSVDMYAVSFAYDVDGTRINAYHVAGDFGGDVVTFVAKYLDDEEDRAIEALETAVVCFRIDGAASAGTGSGDPVPDGNEADFTIVPSRAASVTYTDYDNGLFTAEIPEGWVVNICELSDYIHYTFQIYDPEDPDRRIFFNMKTEGYLSSEEEYRMFTEAYPDTILSGLPWIDPQTTEQFCRIFTQAMAPNNTDNFTFPSISDFSLTESFGTNAIGQETIRGTYTNEYGETVDGIFTCDIEPVWLYLVTGLYVYNTTFITAPEGELTDWIDVFSHVLGSIRFTDTYINNYYDELMFQSRASAQIAQICSEMTDLVIAGWEDQQASYDRISQKQRDATMGYERVYDTETGEIYEAPLDFFDHYHGSQYERVTDDMYHLPIDGYIEWN